MSKLLSWDDEWSLGIAPLDKDHRDLADRYSDIVLRFCPEAIAHRAECGEALLSALAELGEAARRHFWRAETFMASLGYEGVEAHRAENAQMMEEYTRLLHAWRKEKLQVFDESAQTVVREWLLAHILGTNRDFACHFFQVSGQEEPLGSRDAGARLHPDSARPAGCWAGSRPRSGR